MRPLLAAAAILWAAAAAPPRAGATEVPAIDPPGYAKLLTGGGGRVLVVNMWATWCEPCREEFPELVAFDRAMKRNGVTLVAISMDQTTALADQVIPFLRKNGVEFPCYIKAPGDDEHFINAVDPKWDGALPATFVYGTDGRLARRLIGPTDQARLKEAVAPLLPKRR